MKSQKGQVICLSISITCNLIDLWQTYLTPPLNSKLISVVSKCYQKMNTLVENMFTKGITNTFVNSCSQISNVHYFIPRPLSSPRTYINFYLFLNHLILKTTTWNSKGSSTTFIWGYRHRFENKKSIT